MRDRGCRRRACRHVGMGVLLVATMVAMLVGPAAVVPAAARTIWVPTRVVVLHADWSLGPVEVYINQDEVLSDLRMVRSATGSLSSRAASASRSRDLSGLNYNSRCSTRSTRRPLVTTTPDRHQPPRSGWRLRHRPIPDGGARVRIVQGRCGRSTSPRTIRPGRVRRRFAIRSASDYTVVPAGTYDFDLRRHRRNLAAGARRGARGEHDL